MKAAFWKRVDQEAAVERWLAPRVLLGRLISRPMGEQLTGLDLAIVMEAAPDEPLVAGALPISVRDAIALLQPVVFSGFGKAALVSSAPALDRRPAARKRPAGKVKAKRVVPRRPRAKTEDEQVAEFARQIEELL